MTHVITIAVGAILSAVLVTGGVQAVSSSTKPVSSNELYTYGK